MARVLANYLCLIGVAIGLISLIGPWAIYSYPPGKYAIDDYSWRLYHPLYIGAPSIFLIGILLALITPLGGLLQMIGIVETVLIPTAGNAWNAGGYHLTIFVFVGVLSSLFVIWSIRSPTWISRDDKSFPRRRDRRNPLSRLLTFSIIKKKAPEEA